MTTIVTRAGKGAPLTNVEVAANFTNLNNDKIEKSGGAITANSASAAQTITQVGTCDSYIFYAVAEQPFKYSNAR